MRPMSLPSLLADLRYSAGCQYGAAIRLVRAKREYLHVRCATPCHSDVRPHSCVRVRVLYSHEPFLTFPTAARTSMEQACTLYLLDSFSV